MQLGLDTRFAGVDALGPSLSHHPLSRRGRLENMIAALACFAAAPLLLRLTAARTALANTTDSPVFVNSDPLFIYWPAAFGVALLLVGAWLVFTTTRNWNTAAAIYEHGLAVIGPTGLQQFPWGAVREVRQLVTNYHRNGVHTRTAYLYTVRTQDGQTLKFNNRFVEIEELGKAIQRNVSAALLPRYVQELNGGQRLAFGPLAIDHQGVYAGPKSLPWAEVEAVKIQDGSITIRNVTGDGGSWAPVPLAQVPNVWVFYQIVGHFTTVE